MTKAELYARALWEYTASSESTERDADAFIELLKRRGHYKLLPAIVRALKKIAAMNREGNKGVLSCASKNEVEKYAAQLTNYGIDAKNVSVDVNDNLIGGFRYEEKDTVIDGCYRTQLLHLYRELIA